MAELIASSFAFAILLFSSVLVSFDLSLSCFTFTASVSCSPAATLTSCRSAPELPTETVLSRSVAELLPIATLFPAVT
ncbi:hypothetical protein CRW83_24735 [Salmonella enterica subsp. enterica serovar Newport]|nr:hypothetical protein [Salmonella enterica subsp. enterica serovar Newport]EDL3512305.1 hypothetical protein [Salmonella enterica subsp. enterica serovar Newport]